TYSFLIFFQSKNPNLNIAFILISNPFGEEFLIVIRTIFHKIKITYFLFPLIHNVITYKNCQKCG
ncbi:hypothetical protein D3M79_09660, partial [Rodentibacter pneumotropicus]